MRLLSRTLSRCRYFFYRQQAEKELDEELHSYVEMLAAEKAGGGANPGEARRAARIELGGIEQVKEEVRAVRAGAWFEALLQDLRFGVRMLRKNPAFTAVAVVTLALGIGANTAIFSVTDAVLLKPLPFDQPDRLVAIYHTPPEASFPGIPTFSVSPANFLDWRSQNHTFDGMAAYGFSRFMLTGAGRPDAIPTALVTGNFFSVLRVRPIMGRPFLEGEDDTGSINNQLQTFRFPTAHAYAIARLGLFFRLSI